MANSFGLVFWGLVLIGIDVRVGFDLLPDFIGYILVAIGCSRLGAASRRFPFTSNLAWIMVGLSLISIVMPGGVLSRLLYLVSALVDCGMMWQLLAGIIELTEVKGRSDLAKDADRWRTAYMVIAVIGAVFVLLAVGSFLNALLSLAYLVVVVLIVYLIHRVKLEVVEKVSI
ncbi:MAG TPA: hypothetical protein VGH19_14390 [Verrucomicrobiae bacterium]